MMITILTTELNRPLFNQRKNYVTKKCEQPTRPGLDSINNATIIGAVRSIIHLFDEVDDDDEANGSLEKLVLRM